MPVADTILRLAYGDPSFFLPRWTPDILIELERTLEKRFHYSEAQVKRRLDAMQKAFPEALVTGYESLIPAMKNDSKDAHVLAAAVTCGAHAIVSDNKKHFPAAALVPHSLECLTAAEFLLHQYHFDSDAFISLLEAQAKNINRPLKELLAKLPAQVAELIKI